MGAHQFLKAIPFAQRRRIFLEPFSGRTYAGFCGDSKTIATHRIFRLDGGQFFGGWSTPIFVEVIVR